MKYIERNRTVEPHSESILYLYLQDENGIPVPNEKCKIYAGPPPTGIPPYFVDDDPNNPNRRTDANGKFQFIVSNSASGQGLDFFVQLIGKDGTPESDPIHFPFPAGEGRWVIVTMGSESQPSPDGGGDGTDHTPQVPPVPELNFDPRLTAEIGAAVQKANVVPGQAYWKLISAQYQDPEESGGNVSIVCFVQDDRGIPLPAQPVTLVTTGGDTATQITDERGHCDHPMGRGSNFDPGRGMHGPLSVHVGGLPSDTVTGMGLPLNRHVQYILVWRRVTAGDQVPLPPPATGAVRGKITNAPIGTQVLLINSETTLTAPIGLDGSYNFLNVKTGEYALELSSGQVIKSPLAVIAGQVVTADFEIPVSMPPPGNLRGRISDAPAGARLVLRSGDKTFDTLVALDGSYSFTGILPGSYILTLSGVGVINPTLTISSGETATFDYPLAPPPTPAKKLLTHYLLFGPGTQSGTLTNLIIALDYIVRYAPVCGFSVDEAMNAEHVTIVGGNTAVSAEDEKKLKDSGCQVARLTAPDSYALENLFQQLLSAGSPYPS